MPDIQGGYSERQELYSLGQIAESQFKDVVSKRYVGAAALPFGRAMTYNGNVDETDVGGAVFDGIVVSNKVLDPVGNPADTFSQNAVIGLLRKGTIVVRPTVAVVPGDPVHFTPADGSIQIAGGTLIDGARFETAAAANELAVVHLG